MKKSFRTGYVFLIALGVSLCAALPVMIANGGKLYLIGDYMTQQIPFIHECRRLLFSGKPFWSSNTFLGANFLGTYSFYNYGSPFYWILYLLPESLTGAGLSVTFVLRHAVAAATAHIYLKKHVDTPHFAVIGALIYTFSSFTMDSTYYFHFIDVIAVFPLIPYLVDEVLEGKKKIALSLAVLLNAMINYYFFFITSVFFLIYLAFRMKFGGKYTFRDAVRCVAFYALGGFSAMFILLPSALSLLETYKATNSFSAMLLKGLGCIPQIIKLLEGMVLPSEGISGSATGFNFSNFNSNAAFLPYFGPIFMFVSLKKKEAVWYFKLMKFLFALSLIPFGNGLFSFFTNLSYTRWWYCFVLISVLVSIKTLEENPDTTELKSSTKTAAAIASAVTAIPVLLKLVFAYTKTDFILKHLPSSAITYLKNSGLTDKFSETDFRYLVVLIALTAATYIPLYFSLKRGFIFNAKNVIPVVAIICIFSYSVYLTNEAKAFDTENYRGADLSASQELSYTHRTLFDYGFANYPAVANRPGITAFHSFKSHATAEFCRLAGYKDTLHSTADHCFTTPAIQSVLSIKTLVDKSGNEAYAPYYSPFGYVYEHYIIDEGYEYTTDISENNRRIELMTRACFVDRETAAELDGIAAPLDSDTVDWKAACAGNMQSAAVGFELNSSGFTAVSKGDKQRLIYFSIPHDNGWRAYVNGKETEILTINGGLMGIIVPEGECSIEFRFTTPGLAEGVIISSVFMIITTVYTVIEQKKKRP